MPNPHLVETLFDRPIAFHRVFAKLTGSLNAGLMLSQAVFWSKRTKDSEGWFYKSQAEWEDEVCLTRREQDTARAKLRSQMRKNAKGKPLPQFWFEERRGLPARIYYRVDFDCFLLHLQSYHATDAQKRQSENTDEPDLTGTSATGNAQKRQTRLAENAKLDATKTPIRNGENVQTRSYKNANHSLQRLHAKNTARKKARVDTRAPLAASRFSETEILRFLDATKPRNKARNPGLAHKLYLTGEDDHLLERWQAHQQPPPQPQPTTDAPELDELRAQARAAGLTIPGLN